jgi:hypothetical protein
MQVSPVASPQTRPAAQTTLRAPTRPVLLAASVRRRQALQTGAFRAAATLGAAVAAAGSYFYLVVPYAELIPSPRASDRRHSKRAQERVDVLAVKAGMARPIIYVHLSLPGSAPAASDPHLTEVARWVAPKMPSFIMMRRELFSGLSEPLLDCIIAHEMGHIALKASNSPVYLKADQDFDGLSPQHGQVTEYAADWFGMQLCGRKPMLNLYTSAFTYAWAGDEETSEHDSHPSPSDRYMNLLLSNETYFHVPEHLSLKAEALAWSGRSEGRGLSSPTSGLLALGLCYGAWRWLKPTPAHRP